MIKAVAASVGAIAVLWATSSGFSQTARQCVAGHQFDVPKDHIFNARIAWLPAPESDSFVFFLNTDPNLNHIPKHRIVVEPLAGRCQGGITRLMDVACGKAKELVGRHPRFERRQNELGSWSSDLFVIYRDDRNGQTVRQQVADCQLFEPNPVKPKPSSLCTTVWAYKSMLLQFSFDEAEADRVPQMKAEAMALLDRWEVH
jgi:hypothetical protein